MLITKNDTSFVLPSFTIAKGGVAKFDENPAKIIVRSEKYNGKVFFYLDTETIVAVF